MKKIICKKIILTTKARLAECYQILNNAPYNGEMFNYRMWRQAVRYIEEKSSKKEFIDALNRFLI